mgnify:CR=1 FL=1|jgi:hypothetical protein
MSISNTHEFIELRLKGTNQTTIVEEYDDFYFDHGWKFVRYVPNHEVDDLEVFAKQMEVKDWVMKNSPADPMMYLRVQDDTSGTSEGYFYEEPEIY